MPTPPNISNNVRRWLASRNLSLADVLIAVLLLVVPFHAFLTIWVSTFVGHFVLLRLWDELLLFVLCSIVVVQIIRDMALRQWLYKSAIARLIAVYVLLTILLGCLATLRHAVAPAAVAYGLIINLRFLVWFLCVCIVARRSVWLQRHWRTFVFVPLTLVAIFGGLQFFVLPHDFLAHFGYGPSTYVPFITINQDSTTIRVQSFLRGANPLGAYMAALIGVLIGVVKWTKKDWRLWLLFALSVLVLGLSFSRSGWIGAFIAILVGVGLRLRTRHQRLWALGTLACAIIILGGILFALRSDIAVQDAILHVSSNSTAIETSNEGHVASLQESVRDIIREPLGEGPGTSGQASWYDTDHPIRNTESYLLQIGEEVGWVGLGLFVLILGSIGHALWRRKDVPLALGLLAGLCGLFLVSSFAYAWTDDTLAFVWWGLAGIALAMPEKRVDGAQHVA